MNIWYTDKKGNNYFAPSNMPIDDSLQRGLVTVYPKDVTVGHKPRKNKKTKFLKNPKTIE